MKLSAHNNMIKKTVWSGMVLVALILTGCSKGPTNEQPATKEVGPKSRVVQHQGLRFVFDLMTAADHDRMAKMMEVDMRASKGMTHYVSLTIVDDALKKPLSNATVKMDVKGPDGKPVSEPAHLMEGRGMAHYMVGFRGEKPGAYTVAMDTTVDGAPHQHTVSFTLP